MSINNAYLLINVEKMVAIKILTKSMTDLISQSVTGVFVKRPWRHQIKTHYLVSAYSVKRKSKILFSLLIP